MNGEDFYLVMWEDYQNTLNERSKGWKMLFLYNKKRKHNAFLYCVVYVKKSLWRDKQETNCKCYLREGKLLGKLGTKGGESVFTM